MSLPIICFRTITRQGLFRQVTIDGNKALLPIGIAVPAESVSINPNPSIEKLNEVSCDGRMVPSLTYEKGAEPELEISFGLAAPEIEQLIHGRIVTTTPSVEGMVFAEFLADRVAIPGRKTGEVGFGVVAQTAESKAQAYYIDEATKLAVNLEIVGSAPVGNQIAIGAAMAFTLSPELAASGRQIYTWVPCTFANATAITATPIGLISCFFQGVNFNNTARMVIARNCTRSQGGSLSSEPKRDVRLQILPDVQDGTGLGFQIIDSNLQMVC